MKNEVTILGGGHQGLSMAAHLSLQGENCCLWNRTEEHIQKIRSTGKIYCQGIVCGTANIHYVSTDIKSCLRKLILVTTPSSAHADIARLIAPYVDETNIIVLNPGRTFGILEFENTLRESGCTSLPLVAETQTIVYTCRKLSEDTVSIYAFKQGIPLSTRKSEYAQRVIQALPESIRHDFVPARSYIETSLGNVGMVLHCMPVLMNVGWIENTKVDFKYYYEGISRTIARFLEKIDQERLAVADAMGYPVEPLTVWLKRTYQTSGKDLFECLQNNQYYKDIDAPLSVHHRYIEEDIPNGLVPLEAMGKLYGVPTPNASLVIDLANAVMEKDYRETGRNIHKIKLGVKTSEI